ncbi:PRC-barrel domain protein [Pirellulimonas nuda]|uniref:PRC-barrel domain protein n=1 Tax=Pirellulimonas nuda TaxID=2528009 RepID=A0A518D6L7_9BACT|nr:PRC-barrel domain-containing protein [Pirellulimonas nuda]QDU87128.1 PRC-barrel domain protein [Pirellulimonas nuda]
MTRLLTTALTAALLCLPLIGPASPAAAADATAAAKKPAAIKPNHAKQMHALISSNKIVGAEIIGNGPDNPSVATISDVVMTKDGKGVYAIATVGATLGLGGNSIAIPVNALNCECRMVDGEKNCSVKIDKTAEQLEAAPEVSLEGYEDVTVASFVDRNNRFYGADAAETFASRDDMMCASKLTDAAVYCDSEEECGTLEALIVDAADHQAKYAIIGDGATLGIGEKYSAVPFEALNFKMDREGNVRVMINAEARVIGAAPKVTPSDYPELDKDAFRKDVSKALAATRS